MKDWEVIGHALDKCLGCGKHPALVLDLFNGVPGVCCYICSWVVGISPLNWNQLDDSWVFAMRKYFRKEAA